MADRHYGAESLQRQAQGEFDVHVVELNTGGRGSPDSGARHPRGARHLKIGRLP